MTSSTLSTPAASADTEAAWGRRRLSRWLVALVFTALVGWYLAFAVQRYETSHLYGDEPEYVFAGESVWKDGDLDLRNQFLSPDRHAFPGPLTFKVDPRGGPAPANFMPTEGVLLTEPANIVGGILGIYLLFATMNLAALLLLFVVLRRTFSEAISALTVGLVGLTVPLAWHAASVWTEVPVLLIVCAVLAVVPAIGRRFSAALAVGALLALLPWLHQKYAPLALSIVAALLLSAARRRYWPVVAGLPVLSTIGTIGFSYALRGRWNFTISGTSADIQTAFDSSFTRFLRQPAAWFLDSTRGWLPLAPVWLIAGLGLLVLLRFPRGRRMLVLLAVAFVPFFLVYFWGPFLAGDSPPGRETLPAIPAMAILLAAGLSALRGVVATAIAAVLAAVSVGLATVGPFRYGFDIMFNNVGRPKLLEALSRARIHLADLFPSFTATPGTWSVSAFALTSIAGLALIGVLYYASRLAGLSTGRPWTLAGQGERRPSRTELGRALRAVAPRRAGSPT